MKDRQARPLRVNLVLLAAAVLFAGGVSVAKADPPGASLSKNLTVMTRNLYFGFDETALLAAPDLPALITAAAQAWADVQNTDFPARARSIAREIVLTRADLVGLQEAVRYEIGVPNEQGGFDALQELDFVKILLAELRRLGGRYAVAAKVSDTDVALPINADFSQWVRLTDRDVILVRADLPPEYLRITSSASGNYSASVSVPLPGGATLEILRGWVSVDVKARGDSFRFISTHLEDASSGDPGLLYVQELQAQELLAGPAITKRPVILVADSNSDADVNAPTYELLTGAGFTDTWRELHRRAPGFTCCQDGDLANKSSKLYERIDLILTRGDFRPVAIQVVGDTLFSKVLTPSGLIWPSDHAGVFAVLQP